MTRFRCENFKALASLDVGFERFTVLVGANGCGKSTVLEGIERLASTLARATGRDGRDPLRAGSQGGFAMPSGSGAEKRQWATCGRPVPVLLELHADELLWMSAVVSPDQVVAEPTLKCGTGDVVDSQIPPQAAPVSQRWSAARMAFEALVEKSALAVNGPDLTRPFEVMHQRIGRPERIRLDAEQLAGPAARESLEATMDARGKGLPVLLAELALNRPAVHMAILADLRQVVPTLRGLKYPPAQVGDLDQKRIGYGLQIEFETGALVDAANVSEGTLLTLGLLARIHGSDGPTLILLDDIDRGLHPVAQAELCACIRRLLAVRNDVQVIATSHSPYILDHFDVSEVRVMGFGADNLARVRALAEHPDAARMKGFLKTGEFWGTVGEQWVASDDR